MQPNTIGNKRAEAPSAHSTTSNDQDTTEQAVTPPPVPVSGTPLKAPSPEASERWRKLVRAQSEQPNETHTSSKSGSCCHDVRVHMQQAVSIVFAGMIATTIHLLLPRTGGESSKDGKELQSVIKELEKACNSGTTDRSLCFPADQLLAIRKHASPVLLDSDGLEELNGNEVSKLFQSTGADSVLPITIGITALILLVLWCRGCGRR